MLNLSGLKPIVRHADGTSRLHWQIENKSVQTDFNRFRPVKISLDPKSKNGRIEWRDFCDIAMTDPFFKNTVERAAMRTDAADPFHTTLRTLAEVGREPTALPVAGFIFHMGRVGSTLIHKLLSRTGKVHSLSEPLIFDRAFQVTASWPDKARHTMLRDVIATFQHPRRPNERCCVIKMTDAVGSVSISTWRKAFPDVPWIFVYRDPIEVMVSTLRSATGMMDIWSKDRADAAERLQMSCLANTAIGKEEFVARTLQKFCENAIDAARTASRGTFLAVSYSRLPEAVWETIAPHFGINLSTTDIDIMRDEARLSAKSLHGHEFVADCDEKQREATDMIINLAKKLVFPPFEELRSFPQA